jgi:hypothetical protein
VSGVSRGERPAAVVSDADLMLVPGWPFPNAPTRLVLERVET